MNRQLHLSQERQPQNIDLLIIPSIFYEDTIRRNDKGLINKIKYNPVLAVNVNRIYNNVLSQAFAYRKAAKSGSAFRIPWKNYQNENIVLSFPEQYNYYAYCVQTIYPNGKILSNYAYLVNVINNYLVQLRQALHKINLKQSAQYYFPLGVNVHNDVQMKLFIRMFFAPNNNI